MGTSTRDIFTMLASRMMKLTGARNLLLQTRGKNLSTSSGHCNPQRTGYLPTWDAAQALPMKYGWVYMGVFMGFWGLCYVINPFRERHLMDKGYEQKWKSA